jgi:hypothetical protein
MSNKFLNSLHGESLSVLTNGTASLYLKSLKINDLEDSKNVVTDDKFLTTGGGASELTFINTDEHTSPVVGISKIYFKTDGNLYKKNSLGEESTLAGGYSLITLNESELGQIDYKSEYDKVTWSDTTLDTHNFYNYYASPYKPKLRTPFVPLNNRATNVFSEADLDLAISDQKDNIFIATDFDITSPKLITFACKIHGDSVTKPTITAVGIATSLFNVSSDDVFFENLILTNDNTSSNTNCIFFGFNNDAKNNCVHDCVFNTNEFAIISSHYQVQIYNNVFQFVGTPDSHRYISLNRCIGEVLIYNNVFHSNGISSTACLLINSSNGSVDFDSGHLVIYGNVSATSNIQRVAIMETEPINFKLSLIENTIETYTDFFILYGDTMLNGFKEIVAYKNTVTLIPISPGFKGAIGWDTPGSGGVITYSPIIRASLNVLPNNLRTDYSPLPNSTSDNPIVCFKNTRFTTSLTIPINPPLVAFSKIGVSKDEVDALETNVATNTANIATNTTKTQNIVSSDNSTTEFFDTVLVDKMKVQKLMPYNVAGDIDFRKQDNTLLATVSNLGNINANSFSINGSGAITDAGSGAIITTAERNSITSNVSKLVNQSAVSSPTPITTLEGELDVAVIKSYQHNCELQFDDTDASLSADGTITLTAPTVILNGSVSVVGQALSNQTSFTQDQQLITKKYVDDANNAQNTFISTNTAANIGSVTVHQDVSDAGSGAIITTAERNAINSNTDKTQNITATPNVTTFTGTIGSSNVKATDKIAIGTAASTRVQEADAIAIGTGTGLDQKCCGVAIGRFSGSITQQKDTIGIGNSAGYSNQQEGATAVGYLAGGYNQGLHSVSIGYRAGENGQGESSIAIGNQSGKTSQGAASISLGYQAGNSTQGAGSISLGYQAGNSTQGAGSISLGYQAGNSTQGTDAVAIGYQAGNSAQGQNTIAIGPNSGQLSQSTNSIAFGNQAAYDSQGQSSIAIGNRAGRNSQGQYSVAIGGFAGGTQGQYSVAIGDNAGQTSQGSVAIAIGSQAGNSTQGGDCIAIGDRAGQTGQVDRCIAIGRQAGQTSQQNHGIAIGWNAGNNTQSLNSIAIGTYSGSATQGQSGIAIGNNAGQTNQGANSIAIGDRAGLTNQAAGSIILNATGTALNAGTSGIFVSPVRNASTAYHLFYDPTTGEISYSA